MDLFSKKECQRCIEYQKEVELLSLRNQRLEKALIELKERYENINTKGTQKEQEATKLSSNEIDSLFQKIKQSAHDRDTKRYLRSILMLLKSEYESSLYEYIISHLE